MAKNPKPREYTTDEVREKFLQYIHSLCHYWRTVENPTSDRFDGLAFSILAMLDGSSIELPAFAVVPAPHQDDKLYHIEEGSNWFPEFRPWLSRRPGNQEPVCDIAGNLHEQFLKRKV
jgi:hypothetical protein